MINFKELNNKKIIVTGSSTGIGFETAIQFLNLNAKVVFHGNKSIKNLNLFINSGMTWSYPIFTPYTL